MADFSFLLQNKVKEEEDTDKMGAQKKSGKPPAVTDVRSAFSDAMPKYRTIEYDMITLINRGIYAPGMKMDSIRDLAGYYDVSIQVIQMAVAELEKLGYIYTVPKSGMYVTERKKTGPFHCLGIFVLNYPVYQSGIMIETLAEEIQKRSYSILLGGNFEKDYTLDEWLERKHVDGVFLLGVVEETDLLPLIRRKIPYFIFGNHNIAPSHPQMTLNVYAQDYKTFVKTLPAWKGRKIGAIFGIPESRGDRERRQAMIDAWNLVNGSVDESLFLFSEIDGYKETEELIEKRQVEFLFIGGGPLAGYRRYFFLHPEQPKPNLVLFEKKDLKTIPNVSYIPFHLKDFKYKKAVSRMFSML